jgi:hypothetical protein
MYQKYCEFRKDHANDSEDDFFNNLMKEFNISYQTALNIWYAVQRSWFKPEMVEEFIRLDNPNNEGFRPILTVGHFCWDDKTKRFKEAN